MLDGLNFRQSRVGGPSFGLPHVSHANGIDLTKKYLPNCRWHFEDYVWKLFEKVLHIAIAIGEFHKLFVAERYGL